MATYDSANLADIFKGFSKLSREERLGSLVQYGILKSEDIEYLRRGGLKDFTLGEKFIENVIGYFQLPLGIATNFKIDGKDHVIPMAVEETSIVAAASKTAKWVREKGFIVTETVGENILGQIQISQVRQPISLITAYLKNKNTWIQQSNEEVAQGLVRRGGGVRDLTLRWIDRDQACPRLEMKTSDDLLQIFSVPSQELLASFSFQDLSQCESLLRDFFQQNFSSTTWMAVLHVHMNPCEAMGANIINQVCEFLKSPLEMESLETVTMGILSNLADTKLTRATVILEDIEPELAAKIEEASLFAEMDPYRAATNNKGVLNGIDPILIATGNDWRAVEAGIHAYACRSGQYRSITRWRRDGMGLVGVFEAPLIVGTVGGVTTLHPTASMCLKMLDVESANHLARVMAAVGLVQNLGALKALTTVGIIEGHMKLHIKNLTLGAGAEEKEIPYVQKKLEEILAIKKRISLSHAIEVLKELRHQNPPH